jgi:hypothetical protein
MTFIRRGIARRLHARRLHAGGASKRKYLCMHLKLHILCLYYWLKT